MCKSRKKSHLEVYTFSEENTWINVAGVTADHLIVTLNSPLKATFKVIIRLSFVFQIGTPIFDTGFLKSRTFCEKQVDLVITLTVVFNERICIPDLLFFSYIRAVFFTRRYLTYVTFHFKFGGRVPISILNH